jgi:hypothetical protein
MYNRTQRLPRRMLVPAILALCWGGLLLTAEVVAQCTQGCSQTDSGTCQGSSSGRCDSCIMSTYGEPAQCSNWGGTSYFTGTAIYGSTTGNGSVTFSSVPCKKSQACLNGAQVQGSCDQWALCGYCFACNADGMGGCQQCTSGTPVTSSWAQQCNYSSCGG